MFKSALGMVILLCAFAITLPVVHAQAVSAKKQTSRKAIKKAEKRAVAKTRRSGSTAAKSAAKREKSSKKVAVTDKRKMAIQRVAYKPAISTVMPSLTAGDIAGLHLTPDPLSLKSNAVLVIDQTNAHVLFEKNANIALPIASLTKLMTALIVMEARQNMDEMLEVTSDDIDREKNSSSRLRVGSQMTRANMLHIALMSSENRAASALGRHYPGGLPAFVAVMNARAKTLGMNDTHFVDSTGLSSHNIASARDLAKLVIAAHQHSVIREYSTNQRYAVNAGGYQLHYMNSNRLVMNPEWDIGLQKTGYISEAGRCLVMQSRIEGRPVVMVFLDSKSKDSRLADASRIRKWLEMSKPQTLTQAVARQS